MTEAQKQRLERQLWNIANELRGKMPYASAAVSPTA
ncbi:type I restriction-modification system subunit M N-terminal domain-containing protein [Sulfitobacter geojensis]|nr:type I restriction-modification system subunit M N-terminal domain-containing protein [Sulfitobacter geojensis]